MTEVLVELPPPGGWTVDHLDALPESHHRYELTDGALTASPSPSSLHQAVSGRLYGLLDDLAPEPFAGDPGGRYPVRPLAHPDPGRAGGPQ